METIAQPVRVRSRDRKEAGRQTIPGPLPYGRGSESRLFLGETGGRVEDYVGCEGGFGMPDARINQEQAGLDLSAGIRKADRLGAFLISLPRWIAYAVIAWQMRLSIEALAGQYAFPSLLTRFWRQASAWEVVCWIAGMLGLLLGLYSRHLLKRHVIRDLSRLDALEQRLDELARSKLESAGSPVGGP